MIRTGGKVGPIKHQNFTSIGNNQVINLKGPAACQIKHLFGEWIYRRIWLLNSFSYWVPVNRGTIVPLLLSLYIPNESVGGGIYVEFVLLSIKLLAS